MHFVSTASKPLRNFAKLDARRCLNLHEYQAKELMAKHGIPSQKFALLEMEQGAEAAEKLASMLKVSQFVVKSMIHAGGRGKGHFLENNYKGGVHIVDSVPEVVECAKNMLGNHLKTKQTVPGGIKVRKLMIAEALNITSEKYFAILMDRSVNGPIIIASSEGGMDIEEVAKTSPEKIHKLPVDIVKGVDLADLKVLAKKIGFKTENIVEAARQMKALYDMFITVDSTQIEINPFGETKEGAVLCFDAKLNFDDNAQFRQKDIFALRDIHEEDPQELDAAQYDLNFVNMDGNIGCMVNGAGLAMATMDIIQLHGGSPANFLDLGGGVKEEYVSQALRILTFDQKVKSIFINIFGGIVDCSLVAQGVINASKTLRITLPITMRLKGTNEAKARDLIANSGLPIVMIEDVDEAAISAVNAAKN